MIPGANPKQMQAMMKKMGISQNEILASKVIIEKKDGERLIIDEPNVIKIKMQGQTSFQITGEDRIETAEVEDSSEDISIIMEKTGCTKEEAKEALEKTGDLTDAIMELS
ncbi:MAG: nascent polypeptide-associated complex protein [Nanoarchaeota archaeon]|jgi:nascent polypeptide-associated complex subunit alpha|nr:nascent polypeptide-associated complex protein [Nanoarchaeota archaeon]